MTPVTIIVVLAGIPAAIALALLVIVVAAIHAEERALSLAAAPATRTRRLARRVTGAYASQPLAARTLDDTRTRTGRHPQAACARRDRRKP
jgi:hypothetical protein